MNDMTKPPASGQAFFEIPKPAVEVVETANFGVVTLTAPPTLILEEVFRKHAGKKDEGPLYRALVAACARGANGERFTEDGLAGLPGQCLRDWTDLRKAAMVVAGLDRKAVGNS
jgi:hypothetical protein